MSLSSVLQIAQNSLANVTRRTGVLSRNIADANSDFYARREMLTVTLASGAQTSTIRRATDVRLERAVIDAASSNAGNQLLSGRLDALNALIAGEDGALAVTDRITVLHGSLQAYSGAADNSLLGQAALNDARDLVSALNGATDAVQDFRLGIDKEIGETVGELNALLSEFERNNIDIKNGTTLGPDVSDALDRRSALLNDIAEIVPISVLTRDNDDVVLLTASGATLFETEPRFASFTPATALAPGMPGNPVFADVVRLNLGRTQGAPVAGKLEALLQLRDVVAPALQSQLDETARSLISAFAETDASGGALPPLQGLFTWPGGPGLPPAGILVNGLAGAISINSAYDPDAGGAVTRLRDGGANGPGYNANLSGLSAFSDRLIGLVSQFDAPQAFDASAGLGSGMSLLDFTSLSGGFVSGRRSEASASADLSAAKLGRISESLSNATGVNIDIELAKLGELENGYQASARLLNAADEMLQSLLNAIG